ncbi:MAG: SusC/RagA family TonB-linked outer membrane protein [Chitinophagales bacterium]|nr:SusC/RagA family TonB-linked outer membrane protein [Chitinophagales bacterium]
MSKRTSFRNGIIMPVLPVLFLLLLTISSLYSDAQQRSVSGLVLNKKDNSPVAGATVSLKGTKNGVSTDDKGAFSLQVKENETLVISAVGYASAEIKTGKKTHFTISLEESSKELEGVVVTALGISRQQKALGYAQQQIKAEEITDARSNNWSGALSGKVAGLQLLSAGSGPINSTKITLRGDVSLNPNNNNALIVVDGVPMSNKNMTSSGVTNAYGAGSGNDVPVDFGNNINDINPDDIETITILKGPGATALYGSRASNGAILITTKSGIKKDKGIGITFNSNVSFNTVLRWPDYQYEYGQGTGRALNSFGEKYYSYGATGDGASTSGTSSAYGPRFDNQMYYQYDPVLQGRGADRTMWRPYTGNIKDFWRTGSTITNSVSIEGGNDKGSARLSLTHSKNEWIMPNTGFERVTVQTGTNYKVSDKLKINTKISYTNKSSDNLPATGYNNQSIAYFMIFQNPNVDLNWYRDIWKKGFEQIDQIHPFSSFIDNPYLIAYEMTNALQNHNLVGSASATYEITKKLELMVRSGINLLDEERKQRRPFSTANYLKGYYKEQAISDFEANTDFLITYKNKFKKDISLSASAGGNKMIHRYNRVDSYIDGLVIPGVYKLNNGLASAQVKITDKNYNVNSLYGVAAIGYKDKYFLDLTARNDWSSTLPSTNWSFFYPSVNMSFILSDIFRLPMAVSYAKLRLSGAKAGNDADPYQTQKYYGTSEFASSGSVETILYNARLKPEISTSYEAGLDLRFLKNKIALDFTFYNSETENQIVQVPMNWATGYSAAFMNSGKVRNRGVELVLTTKNISRKNFTWNSTFNWSKNQNRVLSLAEDLGGEDNQIIGTGGNATIIAKVGGSTGDIYGFGFSRSPDGQIVYGTNGLPVRPVDIQYIGSAFADWKGGLQNEFRYRDFRFSFLLDGSYGGIIYSQTHHKMTEQGKLKHTLRGREENFIIGEGVVDAGGGRYVPNTTKVLPVDYFTEYYRRANVEANSFDASYLKLREARIEYSLPKKMLGKSFVRQATFALYGRDLLLFTRFPIFDPETAALNGSTLLPGVEMGQLPSSRTMGANLTLKF